MKCVATFICTISLARTKISLAHAPMTECSTSGANREDHEYAVHAPLKLKFVGEFTSLEPTSPWLCYLLEFHTLLKANNPQFLVWPRWHGRSQPCQLTQYHVMETTIISSQSLGSQAQVIQHQSFVHPWYLAEIY